jgi:hypothetical protein
MNVTCVGLHVKCPLFLSDFNATCIFTKIFEEYSNIKLHKNLSSGSRGVPCGRTDRHDEGNCRSSQFCERA